MRAVFLGLLLMVMAGLSGPAYTQRLFPLQRVQVSGGPAITVNGKSSGASVMAGVPITVAVSGGPGNPKDWMGVCNTPSPTSGANCEHSGGDAWAFLSNCASDPPASGVTSGSCTLYAPVVTGPWYVDYLTNNTYNSIASASFTVTPNTQFPEIVQAPSASFASNSPCNWTIPQAIAWGDTVVGFVHTTIQNDAGEAYPTSVTDNAGNTYVLSSGVHWEPYPEDIGYFYKTNVTGNPTVFHVNFGNGQTNDCNVGLVEYSSVSAVTPIVGPTQDHNSPTPSISISPATPSYIWAFGATNSISNASMLSSGFNVLIDDQPADGLSVWGSVDQLSGTQTLTFENGVYANSTCLDGTQTTTGCSAVMIAAGIH